MINTEEDFPIYEEFNLGKHPSVFSQAAAVMKHSARDCFMSGVSSFVLYDVLFNIQDLRATGSIHWKDNATQCLRIGAELGIQTGISAIVTDSMAMVRGERKIYDPIIGGAVAGAAINCFNGPKEIAKGAVSGAIMPAFMILLQQSLAKMNSTTAD